MDKHHIIETLGDIWKEITLQTMDDHVMDNTFVLESLQPYPGYHHATPHDQVSEPGMIFLILKRAIPTETFIRMTQRIKKIYDRRFDGTPAVVRILNHNFDAIRIKDYESLDTIPEIMAYYKDEGAQFRKHKTLKGKATIKITKYLLMEQLTDTIYKDAEDPNMIYFELPCQLGWKMFEKVTRDLKRNVPDANWDAAMGVIYRKSGIVDVVRIYKENCTIGMIEALAKKYASEINRYQ